MTARSILLSETGHWLKVIRQPSTNLTMRIFVYSDVKYYYEDIGALHETIRKKYDIMMKKKQKRQNQECRQ